MKFSCSMARLGFGQAKLVTASPQLGHVPSQGWHVPSGAWLLAKQTLGTLNESLPFQHFNHILVASSLLMTGGPPDASKSRGLGRVDFTCLWNLFRFSHVPLSTNIFSPLACSTALIFPAKLHHPEKKTSWPEVRKICDCGCWIIDLGIHLIKSIDVQKKPRLLMAISGSTPTKWGLSSQYISTQMFLKLSPKNTLFAFTGAMADSYYEYLVQLLSCFLPTSIMQHQLLRRTKSQYSKMYKSVIELACAHLMNTYNLEPRKFFYCAW
ncbi:hypothetical protein VP01_347g4 [Puccinia sorghi]|uniref:Uncharacterized protein n=1 Tax=Puccinia sorghi TaxID=27349 RepID=A0A0L6UW16_9BASI|nr:hypothetical protein VP01_347g4 [Puccinia sorghi]